MLERLASPFAPLLLAAAQGDLSTVPAPQWHDAAAVTVVVACSGYPAAARTGDVIAGIDAAEMLGTHVIHAGTARRTEDGALLSSGGRVLSVVASGADLEEARVLALAGAEAIALEGCQHRHDIARTAARDARDALSASSAHAQSRRAPGRPPSTRRSPRMSTTTASPLIEAPDLPGWDHVVSGKVRELYVPAGTDPSAATEVLVVATDRISAYDHSLRPGIPDKGRVLTAISTFWFEQLADIVPTM